MSISERLNKLEGQVYGVDDPEQIFIDDSETMEVNGWTLCSVDGPVDLYLEPGETQRELKSRASRHDDYLRRHGVGTHTKATIFFAIYHPTKKKGFA